MWQAWLFRFGVRDDRFHCAGRRSIIPCSWNARRSAGSEFRGGSIEATRMSGPAIWVDFRRRLRFCRRGRLRDVAVFR